MTIQGIRVVAKQEPLKEEKMEAPTEKKDNYFEIVDELGRGGMGIVLRANHVFLKKDGGVAFKNEVAIKVINFQPEKGSDPTLVDEQRQKLYDKFLAEIQAVSQLKHDNIIRISHFGEDLGGDYEGMPFYVMEYLEGMDLEHFMFKRMDQATNQVSPMSWDEAWPIMSDVIDALGYAHGKNIVHRDIKPANIFLTFKNNGEVKFKSAKVVDFGLAAIVTDEHQQTGQVDGTVDYMSPEQMEGKPPDARTDIYAVGVVLYQLLTGDTPFGKPDFTKSGDFQYELVNPIADGELLGRGDFKNPDDAERFIQERVTEFYGRFAAGPKYPPAMPKAIRSVLEKCLARDPDRRFQSMDELRADVEHRKISSSMRSTEVVTVSSGAKPSPTEMKRPSVMVRPSMLGVVTTPGPNSPTEKSLPKPGGAPIPLTAEISGEATEVSGPPVPESPWAQQAAVEVDPSLLPSSHMPQAETGAPQNQRDIKTMIVRNPLTEDATVVSPPHKPIGKSRRLLYAAIGAAGISAMVAGGVFVAARARSGTEAQPQISSTVQDAPLTAPDTRTSTVRAMPPDAGQAPAPEVHNVTITVTTHPGGVDVLMGDGQVCNTSTPCELNIPQGSEQVRLTFRKSGFREETREVVPDQDRTVDVTLERRRAPPQGPRNPPRGQQGHGPVITSPD
ncbi:MAG TPA: serine/threonine-protein kinase [Candidatus Bilamarchaeum sp.]|nr:serine/threonine-protein kinase [Candidatus Bilamarchaeum sp.]